MTSDRSPIQGGLTSEISPDQEADVEGLKTWPTFRKLKQKHCGDLKWSAIADAAGIKRERIYNLLGRPDRKEMLSIADMQALAPVFNLHWSRIYDSLGEDYGYPVGGSEDDPFIRSTFRVVRHMHESQLHRLPDLAEELALLTGEHLQDLTKFLPLYRKLSAAQRAAIFELAKPWARMEIK